jgi:hypothetical protein
MNRLSISFGSAGSVSISRLMHHTTNEILISSPESCRRRKFSFFGLGPRMLGDAVTKHTKVDSVTQIRIWKTSLFCGPAHYFLSISIDVKTVARHFYFKCCTNRLMWRASTTDREGQTAVN